MVTWDEYRPMRALTVAMGTLDFRNNTVNEMSKRIGRMKIVRSLKIGEKSKISSYADSTTRRETDHLMLPTAFGYGFGGSRASLTQPREEVLGMRTRVVVGYTLVVRSARNDSRVYGSTGRSPLSCEATENSKSSESSIEYEHYFGVEEREV